MIFHTIYSISRKRYSRMDATGDVRLVAKIPIPAYFCKRAFLNLQIKVGELFGSTDILDKDIMRLVMFNRITLFKAALIVFTYEPKNERLLKWWDTAFGGDVDLKRLENEIDRLIHRYKELEQKEPTSKHTFEDIVAQVEAVLGYAMNDKQSLFEFKSAYDMAIKKGKS